MSAPAAAPPVLLVDLAPGEPGGDGHGVRQLPGEVLADPPPEGRAAGLAGMRRPQLRPGTAVVLGDGVDADATTDTAYLAIAAAFLCVQLADADADGPVELLVAEELLPDPGEGVLRLDLDGDRLAELPVELPAVLTARLADLAAAGVGLTAGATVAMLAAPVPARPGALLLTGPAGRSLVATLVDEPLSGEEDR